MSGDERLTIRGAMVVDGTGAAPRRLDVDVRGGRITRVEATRSVKVGAVVMDAGGLILAPGFIDMHSHADLTLPANPWATNSIAQGVTTEIVGNCGFSPAPLSTDPGKALLLRDLVRGLGPDLDFGWQSWQEYLDRLDAARPAVNVVALVGHAALRIAAIGMDERRPRSGDGEVRDARLGRVLRPTNGAPGP